MQERLYLSAQAHLDALLKSLPPADRALYESMCHVRVETAFRDRKFIAYQMTNRMPEKLGTFKVYDFACDDDEGASTQIEWLEKPGQMILIGHTPTKLFELPVFVYLPVHGKINWSARIDDPSKCSLAFPLVIRTQSRKHLREREVTYFETSKSYAEEFRDDYKV